ncbi:hypothetical protein ABIF44_007852 [Bradyrhizobium japonicum]|nr:hypothetical protein [Bradyrhizobium japonicum]MCS3985860.1 hypothetical protein [Bradyrhizobium japonicum]MCS4019324.1 hypothetical protein [Bradyrhizobium japonicum]MCS4206432.1 hypothetical protein [Bradyrhizobium japonicum]MDH6178213.1 hypothetical protein [Bradyrhizobium japonicum]
MGIGGMRDVSRNVQLSSRLCSAPPTWRCARNDGARVIGVVLQVPLSFPAKAGNPVRRGVSAQSQPSLEYWIARSRLRQGLRRAPRYWAGEASAKTASRATTVSAWSQTHLRILAAHFARALPGHSTLEAKRAQGRPGADLAPAVRCAKGSARKPHSSIQVAPITRPSLRSGWTAYAALSREPNSLWPPSSSRKSPAARRLTRLPHSQST